MTLDELNLPEELHLVVFITIVEIQLSFGGGTLFLPFIIAYTSCRCIAGTVEGFICFEAFAIDYTNISSLVSSLPVTKLRVVSAMGLLNSCFSFLPSAKLGNG